MKQWMLLAGVLLAGIANSQVNKCTDTAGRVSYSEAPCAATQRGGQVLDRRATEPVYDPYAAERTMETYRRASEIQRSTVEGVTHQSRGQGGGAALMDHKPNERIDAQSQRNMDRRMAELEADQRRRAELDEQRRNRKELGRVQNQGPINITRCNDSNCWDSQGNRYKAKGDGERFSRGDGRMCRSNGARMVCN